MGWGEQSRRSIHDSAHSLEIASDPQKAFPGSRAVPSQSALRIAARASTLVNAPPATPLPSSELQRSVLPS